MDIKKVLYFQSSISLVHWQSTYIHLCQRSIPLAPTRAVNELRQSLRTNSSVKSNTDALPANRVTAGR